MLLYKTQGPHLCVGHRGGREGIADAAFRMSTDPTTSASALGHTVDGALSPLWDRKRVWNGHRTWFSVLANPLRLLPHKCVFYLLSAPGFPNRQAGITLLPRWDSPLLGVGTRWDDARKRFHLSTIRPQVQAAVRQHCWSHIPMSKNISTPLPRTSVNCIWARLC